MSQQQNKIVTFGEIMLRLCPPLHQRLNQTSSLDVTYGGAEANTAVSLANYGMNVSFVSRLPFNDLGRAAINALRSYGVKTDYVEFSDDRLGIYFLEMGADHRGSKVLYDRENSAMALLQPGMIDWNSAFADASWFHFTGITPAISASANAACKEAVEAARQKGLTVSCDLNYRSALWKYGKSPVEVMPEMVKKCDVLLCDLESAHKMLGLNTEGSSGQIERMLRQVHDAFKNLQVVSSTHRKTVHSGHHFWSGHILTENKLYSSTTYEITQIIDRVGSGDAFMGGLIYGLLKFGEDKQQAVDFATAVSCLKHSISGDFNRVTVQEVIDLMNGDHGGRVKR